MISNADSNAYGSIGGFEAEKIGILGEIETNVIIFAFCKGRDMSC
jgi:hypothetical protein